LLQITDVRMESEMTETRGWTGSALAGSAVRASETRTVATRATAVLRRRRDI
jgi:hypothetical protein